MIATGSFRASLLRGPCVAVIAEYKRKSPSAGPLACAERITEVAQCYADHGATAMSVLTDKARFDGDIDDLAAVAVTEPRLPLLCKDFITGSSQLDAARAAGAAAALLIVRHLSDARLIELLRAARTLDLDALVEVHDAHELERALAAGATLIGINNRNLDTLVTDLGTTQELTRYIPDGITIVSESGLKSAHDVRRMRDAGAHAVLIGEVLLRQNGEARAALLRELASVPR